MEMFSILGHGLHITINLRFGCFTVSKSYLDLNKEEYRNE